MKIIDILVSKANGTLEGGFKFKYDGRIFKYYKDLIDDIILCEETSISFDEEFSLQDRLNDEVEVIEQNKDIEELVVISDVDIYSGTTKINIEQNLEILLNKTNEIIREVNKLKNK